MRKSLVLPLLILGITCANAAIRPDLTQIALPEGAWHTEFFFLTDSGHLAGRTLIGTQPHLFVWHNGHLSVLQAKDVLWGDIIDVNPTGHVIGTCYLGDVSTEHAFAWKGGSFVSLTPNGCTESVPTAITTTDVVVGKAMDQEWHEHAFVWRDGVLTKLTPPDAVSSEVVHVFDSGDVVGMFTDAAGEEHAFLTTDGVFTVLTPPGALWSKVTSVMPDGRVIGTFLDADERWHGCVWENGDLIDLWPPDARTSDVVGYGPSGRLLGHYEDQKGRAFAFTWKDDTLLPIVPPGATGSLATAINGVDQVAGNYSDIHGQSHPFLWAEDVGCIPIDEVGVAEHIDESGRIYGHLGPWETRRAFTWFEGESLELAPGGGVSHIVSIDARGNVLGSSGSHGFLWRDGIFVELIPSGALFSHTIRVNLEGRVIGEFDNADGSSHAYTYQDGKLDVLTPPGGIQSHVMSLGEDGRILGEFPAERNSYAFTWKDGNFTTLGLPGTELSSAVSLEKNGAIFGEMVIASQPHGFLWIDGRIVSLTPGGGISSRILVGNGQGMKAGVFFDRDYVEHAFVVSPAFKSTAIARPALRRKPPRTTRKAKMTLRGTADAESTLVEYSLNGGRWRAARGTETWALTARLSFGKNKILVRSSVAEIYSEPLNLVIRRIRR